MAGKTLAAAAAAAGMSERAARKWQSGALPSTAKAPRTWRTREDPFADVWQAEVVPQLVADTDGRLQVLTLFKALCRRHPGRFQPGQLRTLQRRVRDWRVQYGPDSEVYFEQVAVPGREAAFDFTDASDLGVTLGGVGFRHLLFEWVLSYSHWTYVGLALSETFEALVTGLHDALWTLGAVPAVLRHDNLSAATHELRRSGGRQLTVRFRQVLDHYGLRSSRIQPGKPHENGVAEQAHFRTKTAVEQALLLRGDRDFIDEAAYLRFVRAVVDEARNTPSATRLAEERAYLRPLPSARIPEYTTFQCRVRKWSTIRVGGRIYSVPSRLIGHTVEARQHPSTVEVLYGGRVLCTMPRLRGSAEHRIDYRHIIGSLVRKPGAFARYRFREELFPSLTFRAAYDALGRTHGERADVEYVRLLHLAAMTGERLVEATLRARLDADVPCDYAGVQAQVRPPVPTGLSRSLLNFASGGLPVSAPRSSILRHVSNRTVGRGQRVQGADQVAQVAVAPHPPEARLRLHQRARHPALNHLAAAPPLDPPRVTLNAAHQVLDDVRRAQRYVRAPPSDRAAAPSASHRGPPGWTPPRQGGRAPVNPPIASAPAPRGPLTRGPRHPATPCRPKRAAVRADGRARCAACVLGSVAPPARNRRHR